MKKQAARAGVTPPRRGWVRRLGPTTFQVWNERLHRFEVFENVRVGQQAVRDWLAERWASIGRGYPNRPPDVDTRSMRSWLPRGPEAWDPSMANPLLEGGLEEAEALLVRQIDPDGSSLRIGISRCAAGYLVKVRAQDGEGATRYEKREVCGDRLGARRLALALVLTAPAIFGYAGPLTVTDGDELRELIERLGGSQQAA